MLKLKDKKTNKVVLTIDEEGKEKFDDQWLEEKKKEQKKVKDKKDKKK